MSKRWRVNIEPCENGYILHIYQADLTASHEAKSTRTFIAKTEEEVVALLKKEAKNESK